MNERIKELAEQAYGTRKHVPPVWQFYDIELEKFAELIVRECIGLIRKQSVGEEILGGQRYKTVQLGETIATITEHFGVE